MNKTPVIMLLNRASPQLSRTVGRVSLHFVKQRPHILFGVGLAGTVTSTVMACRATLSLPDTLDKIEKDIDQARGTDSDITYAYVKAVGNVARLYGPSMAVGLVSIGCLSGAHVDLSRRNTSLMAAYSALQAAYDSYRDRVRGDVGDDRELDLHRGIVMVKNGDDLEVKLDEDAIRAIPRVFQRGNANWNPDPEVNRIFLQINQNYFNQKLIAQGHLFLNDVYEQLGFEHSPIGALVGWVADGEGDCVVDLGLYNAPNISNEWGPGIFLDFNVDGIIFDKI